MALKKPSDYFTKQIKSPVDEGIENLQRTSESREFSSFSSAFDSFKNNLEKFDIISEQVDDIRHEIQNFVKTEDLDKSLISQLFIVEQSINGIQERVKSINQKNLSEIRSDVNELTEVVNEFIEIEVPRYRRLAVDVEFRSNARCEKLENSIKESIKNTNNIVEQKYEELTKNIQIITEDKIDIINIVNEKIDEIVDIKDVIVKDIEKNSDIKEELTKKITDLEVEIIRNESHIRTQNENFEHLQENIRSEIKKLNLDELEQKNYKLLEKIKYLEEIFDKFNEKELLTENLLTEPSEVKNEDPLTPLNQKFVTLDQLQDHYRLFINRIQQQLSTLGGGGETRLKYLDDIVGIATNSSAYDNKYLKYNHNIGKFEFSDIKSDDDSWVDGSYGTYTNTSVGIGTSVPQYDLDVNGDINFSGSFYQNGSQFVASRWTTGIGNSIYRDSFIGIGTTNPQYNLDVDGDINFNGSFYQNGSPFVASRWTAGSGDDIYKLNGYVGLGTTNPTSKLTVSGDVHVSGIITSAQFTTGVGNLGFTTNTISGPSEIIIDPLPIGVSTQSGIVRIRGDLYVDGTQTYINSTSIELSDFNVGIATTVGTNSLLDGAGIGIGSVNIRKTITYDFSSDSLKPSENFDLPSGKVYKINEIEVLSSNTIGSGVTNSSLTSVGTLTDLNVAGIVTANDFNSASDIKLKENISVIDSPLDKITKLEGVNFHWKENGRKSLGVIAQEVEKVLPELVSGEESKTVNYNGLIGLLIECVKEQQKEIEELKKLINK